MKRFISVLLAVLMVLSLSACEARENKIAQEKAAKVDEMIYNLGTITINSRIPIEKAEAAYEALDERAKGFVTRHQELVDARTEFLSIRRQSIVDRVEEARAKFEETLDSRAYFLTLYDTRKDCHEGEFDVVDDAVKAAEADKKDASSELGGLLLLCANLARRLGCDAEESLADSCKDFILRFKELEEKGGKGGKGGKLSDLSASELYPY